MSDPGGAYELDGRRIRLGGVFVLVQRTVATEPAIPGGAVPRSYGVAPTGASPTGEVVSAVAPGEAVWLGFEAVDRERPALVRVRVDGRDAVTGGPWSDELSDEPRNYLACPPEYALAGLRKGDRYRPFGLDERAEDGVLERLAIVSTGETPGAVTVALVTPERFTTLTGLEAEPLDPESAYEGWRLP